MRALLHPTLAHMPGESPISFVSRLAHLHLVDAQTFCRDLGLRFQGIVDGCGEVLAALVGLVGERVESLEAEAIRKTGAGVYALKGETVLRPTLRRGRVFVCPHCLADDIRSAQGGEHTSAYGRTLWTLYPIRTCPDHRVALVEVAHAWKNPTLCHDFTKCISPALDGLEELCAMATARTPSDLETYLVDRLEKRPCVVAPWLDAMPWYAVADLCHLVGAVGLHGRDVKVRTFGEGEWHAAGDAGFSIAAAGPGGVTSLLEHLDRTFPHSPIANEGPQALFGELFKQVAFELDKPGLDPLRETMRAYIAATKPVGPRDTMFGRPFERVRHSVRSASLETGMHPKTLRKILAARGVIPQTKTQSDERTTFNAKSAAPLLARAACGVQAREAARHLGLTPPQFRIIEREGFIKPFATVDGADGDRRWYARTDLDRFLARLSRDARASTSKRAGACNILEASRRANCRMGEVVLLIVRRKLDWIGSAKGTKGFFRVLVGIDEVKRHVRRERPSGKTMLETSSTLGTTTRTVAALVRGGHLTTALVVNPVNRCPLSVVTIASLDDFEKTYVSLTRLAQQRNEHPRWLKRDLHDYGIEPALPIEDCKVTFYRRSDIPDTIHD